MHKNLCMYTCIYVYHIAQYIECVHGKHTNWWSIAYFRADFW